MRMSVVSDGVVRVCFVVFCLGFLFAATMAWKEMLLLHQCQGFTHQSHPKRTLRQKVDLLISIENVYKGRVLDVATWRVHPGPINTDLYVPHSSITMNSNTCNANSFKAKSTQQVL
jgi:hypothetical protein